LQDELCKTAKRKCREGGHKNSAAEWLLTGHIHSAATKERVEYSCDGGFTGIGFPSQSSSTQQIMLTPEKHCQSRGTSRVWVIFFLQISMGAMGAMGAIGAMGAMGAMDITLIAPIAPITPIER
jgi:hypothetical protein